MDLPGGSALPEVAHDPEGKDDGEGDVGKEEVLGRPSATTRATKRPDSLNTSAGGTLGDLFEITHNVELSDKDKNDQRRAENRAVDATDGAEGKLLNRVALVLPSLAEADVGDTDGEPGEKCGETRKGNKPVEDGATNISEVDVGKRAEGDDEDERPEGATSLVDVGEDLGGVASLGKGSEGTGAGVDTRETDGENRDTDSDVNEVVHAPDVGLVHDDDERRSVSATAAEKTGLGVRDGETDDEERSNVDKGNTQEGLLDSSGHGLAGVGGLSGGKTNELGTVESAYSPESSLYRLTRRRRRRQ